ncbi:WxL protein peptidoglycan domain-containing protein [Amycolatopsis plumensis]|uniref:WxL protein peptidoglycan domain-containing protein n=1 Tax=Amycolatopsis plumensis TaxID=236508 RepID=A0ABV5UBM3_9PSEU
MHPIARAVASLLAAAAFAGVTAGPVAAQDGVPWTVTTAANDFGADRENFSYTADAGEQITDGLTIANHGTSPLELAVYGADAFTTGTGQLDLLAKTKPSTDVGAWVHPSTDHVTVQSGQATEVPFTVMVPADAKAGDHLGGILTSLTQGDVERRVGLRIRLRVGGDLRPGLSVENLDARYSGTANPLGTGDATLTYTIRNTGNAIVTARQTAAVSGPFGSWRVQAQPLPDSPQLLPGETWQVTTPVHGVTPALYMAATVTLIPLLTDAAGSIAPLATADTTTHSWAVPWTLLTVILIGLVVVALVIRRRRRRAGRHTGTENREAGTRETANTSR